jgi:hypothetical protein
VSHSADLTATTFAATVKFLAAAGVGAAGVVVTAAEPMVPILGIPQSVLMATIIGALIGVLILPTADLTPAASPRRSPLLQPLTVRRLVMLLVRAGALGAVVLAYAVLAAWAVGLLGHYVSDLAGAPQLPLAGISGVLIRRMLPKYLVIADRVTDRIGGQIP